MWYALLASLFFAIVPAETAPKHGSTGSPRIGSYVAVKFNDAPLPGVTTLRSAEGFRHWVKVEQAVVRLQANGRFAASFRYRQQHLRARDKPVASQVLSRTYSGRYTVRGRTISFIPENTGSKRPLQPIPGLLDETGMHVRYVVADGGVRHRFKLDLRFDPSYW